MTALSGNGYNPATVQRQYTDPHGNVTIEQFSYTYDSSTGDYLLTNVLLQRQVNGGAWQNVSQASYTYYADGDVNGAYEDLETATTQMFSNGAWANTGTTYYRYWKQLPSGSSSSSSPSSSSSSSGAPGPSSPLSVHLLKYVLQPTMYDQMAAAGLDPTTASDFQLSMYADFYFEYDGQRRCTKETVKAGSQTFTFAYSQSTNPQGYNSWATKTVETLPDGNQNILYCNYAGQTMLNIFHDAPLVTSPQEGQGVAADPDDAARACSRNERRRPVAMVPLLDVRRQRQSGPRCQPIGRQRVRRDQGRPGELAGQHGPVFE